MPTQICFETDTFPPQLVAIEAVIVPCPPEKELAARVLKVDPKPSLIAKILVGETDQVTVAPLEILGNEKVLLEVQTEDGPCIAGSANHDEQDSTQV